MIVKDMKEKHEFIYEFIEPHIQDADDREVFEEVATEILYNELEEIYTAFQK
jgi:hypothetical protein